MNKKILLGSTIAVVILVLVSFTGVVGYQTTKSSTIARASPLFSVRNKRAIDKESKGFTCDYVGKGEETNIPLSGRMKRIELVQKAVNIISKMDEKTFNNFVARVIFHLKNQGQITDKETSEALQILHNIRENPNDVEYYNTKNIYQDETVYITCVWSPGCLIFLLSFMLTAVLYVIGLILMEPFLRRITVICN